MTEDTTQSSVSTWTEERVELLHKLWAEGLSASQIASELGGVSRNAVIGKAHRLKLPSRIKPVPSQPRTKKKTSMDQTTATTEGAEAEDLAKVVSFEETTPNEKMGATTVKLDFLKSSLDKIELKAKIPSPPSHISLLELTEYTCKWPIGDPFSEDFCFCGAPSGDSSPYCGYHSKIAFQPISERRKIKV